MKHSSLSLIFAAFLAGSIAGNSAQLPAHVPALGWPPIGLSPVMAQFFGDSKSFTATGRFQGEVPVMTSSGMDKKIVPMVVSYSMLDGKLRMEHDMAQEGISARDVATARKYGVAGEAMIIQPDKHSILLVYPLFPAYAEVPMGSMRISDADTKSNLSTAKLDKETVDGHPCEKNGIVAPDNEGKQYEALIWNATDLQGFPIQIRITEGTNSTLIKFTDIKLERPDAKLFDIPAGATKYNRKSELMRAEIHKRLHPGKK